MSELICNDVNIFDKFSILNYDTSNWDIVIMDNTDLFYRFTLIQKILLNLINDYENKRIENLKSKNFIYNNDYISFVT